MTREIVTQPHLICCIQPYVLDDGSGVKMTDSGLPVVNRFDFLVAFVAALWKEFNLNRVVFVCF